MGNWVIDWLIAGCVALCRARRREEPSDETTPSEQRGRRFFEDIPPNPANFPEGLKDGLCSACHSGPLLNMANPFLQIVVPGAGPGTRFQSVGVSELNALSSPFLEP